MSNIFKNKKFFAFLIVAIATIVVHAGIATIGNNIAETTYTAVSKPATPPPKVLPRKIATPEAPPLKGAAPPCTTSTTTTATSTSTIGTPTPAKGDVWVCRSLKFIGVTVTTSGLESGAAMSSIGTINLFSWLAHLTGSHIDSTYKWTTITPATLLVYTNNLLQMGGGQRGIELWAVFECNDCYKQQRPDWKYNNRQAFRIDPPTAGVAKKPGLDTHTWWDQGYLTKAYNQMSIGTYLEGKVNALLKAYCP